MAFNVIKDLASLNWSKMPATIVLEEDTPYAVNLLYRVVLDIEIIDNETGATLEALQLIGYKNLYNIISFDLAKIADDYFRKINPQYLKSNYYNLGQEFQYSKVLIINYSAVAYTISDPLEPVSSYSNYAPFIFGGLPLLNYGINDAAAYIALETQPRILTHNNFIRVAKNQQHFISIVSLSSIATPKTLYIDFWRTDGTFNTSTIGLTDSPIPISYYHSIIAVGYNHLNIEATAGSPVYKYRVYIDNTQISNSITFIVDLKAHYQSYSLIYLNSFMCLDTILCTGEAAISVETKATTVQRFGNVSNGRYFNTAEDHIDTVAMQYTDVYNQSEAIKYKFRTGSMGRQQLMRSMRELLLHRKAWLQDNDALRFIPLIVTTNKITLIKDGDGLYFSEFEAQSIQEDATFSPHFEVIQ